MESSTSATIHNKNSNEDLVIYENLRQEEPIYGQIRKSNFNYFSTEPIYENICEDCGRLYNDEKCKFCFDDDVQVIKSGGSLLPKIINSFRFKVRRKKYKKKTSESVKIEIIHPSLERQTSLEEVVYENLNFFGGGATSASVNEWLACIMRQTEDYEENDAVQAKCIPSRTFPCCSEMRCRRRESDECELTADERLQRWMTSQQLKKEPLTPPTPPPQVVVVSWFEESAEPPAELEQKYLVPPSKVHTSMISPATPKIDNNTKVSLSLSKTHTFMTLYMLSISLNVIILTYDKFLKAFLYHFLARPGANVGLLREIYPKSREILGAEEVIQPKEEEIYQSLWKCRSRSFSSVTLEFDDVCDTDNWEIADEFQPSYDLKEIVDSARYTSRPLTMEHNIEPRNYTKIEILFSQTHPEMNLLTYEADLPVMQRKKEPFQLKSILKDAKRSHNTSAKGAVKFTQDILFWMENLKNVMDDEEDVVSFLIDRQTDVFIKFFSR